MNIYARFADIAFRHRWTLLIAALAVASLAGLFGGDVSRRLINGGYTPTDSPSARAEEALAEHFSAGEPSVVLMLTSDEGVSRPESLAAGRRLEQQIADDSRVRSVVSYFSTGSPDLRSTDGTSALMLVTLHGDEQRVQRSVDDLIPQWRRTASPLRMDATGRAMVNAEIADHSEQDLIKAELIGAPVTLLILIIAFGSLWSAMLPVAVGMLSVAVTSLVLRLLSDVTDVSIFAMNLTTALGFGLAVDYSLFIVARYREELRNGAEHRAAVRNSVVTAGRTVVFSAVTVAISLSALLMFSLFFLRSLAYAGISVVLVAAISAITVLPALLAVLGRRVATQRSVRRSDGRLWARLAHTVMARPVLWSLPVVVVLAVLLLPFTDVRFGAADYRTLPADASSHRTAAAIADRFDRAIGDSMPVLLENVPDRDAVDSIAARLSELSGAASVDGPTGTYLQGVRIAEPGPVSAAMLDGDRAWVRVWPEEGPYTAASERLVRDVRDLDLPVQAAVAGPSATLVDTKASIGDRLPWAVGMIAVATFVLLFLFTGGILVPIKALVLNLLSLTASFGAAVFVFQQGNLRWLVGDFTTTGYLETTIPVLVFCIAFGLSMDYEVFLLSRIREEYNRTGDNTQAVAEGLRRTGRVFTTAAVVIGFVLAVLATSGVTLLKLLGATIALAIMVDAFLVRSLLVPAFMKIAGRANWWAPPILAQVYQRWGLREAPEPEPAPVPELVHRA
jgi:RND superfamily putative drug exporter